jgi:hypothetical protein
MSLLKVKHKLNYLLQGHHGPNVIKSLDSEVVTLCPSQLLELSQGKVMDEPIIVQGVAVGLREVPRGHAVCVFVFMALYVGR